MCALATFDLRAPLITADYAKFGFLITVTGLLPDRIQCLYHTHCLTKFRYAVTGVKL